MADDTESGLRSLSDLSRELADQRDERALAGFVARHSVPMLADLTILDVIDPDGRVRFTATAHADPERAGHLATVAERAHTGRRPTAALLAVEKPTTFDVVNDVALDTMSFGNRDLYTVLRDAHPASALIVPLVGRENRRLGMLTLLDSHNPVLATDLAWRAAMALDNLRLTAEAQDANQVKVDFLASISHELRTPLNAVLGYSGLLLGGVPAPLTPTAHTQVERIALASRHLLNLIDEMLSFTRLETGTDHEALDRVDPMDFMLDVEADASVHARAKDITLSTTVAADLDPFGTDVTKLRQIASNLTSNAIKFTDHGSVTVTLREEVRQEATGERWIVLEVADTGIGIDPAHVGDIFVPFWQVNQTASRTAGGTGLGLSLTRRLARMLGGDVAVTSALGVGSTFTVRIQDRLRHSSI